MDSLIGVIPDDWTVRPLAEVCQILTGLSPASTKPKEGTRADVPVVTPKDLRNNRIADDCAARVTHDEAGELSRYQLLPDDIVCARTGNLGRQGLASQSQRGWLIGPACLRLRMRPMINAAYLVYYLGHPAVRHWIVRNASGAVIPSASARMLGSLPVVVPPAAHQTYIAEILGALDDKIVVHEEISRTTADMRDAVLPLLLTGSDPSSHGEGPRPG